MHDPARSLRDEESLACERRMWAVQRVGWAAMLAVVIAALLGAFGSGVLNERTLDADGVVVTYPYFLRAGAPGELVVFANAPRSGLSVTLNAQYLEKVDIERVTPDAASRQVQDDHLRWVFDAGGRSRVVLTLKPKAAGPVSSAMTSRLPEAYC